MSLNKKRFLKKRIKILFPESTDKGVDNLEKLLSSCCTSNFYNGYDSIILISQLGNPFLLGVYENLDGEGILTTTKL